MTLTETSRLVKKALGALLGVLLLWLIVRVGWDAAGAIHRRISPPLPPKPEARFGKLPALDLPAGKIDGASSFLLETVDGKLPALPNRFPVYAMVERPASLLAGQKAAGLAKKLGFAGDARVERGRFYAWQDAGSGRAFKLDAATGAIELTTDFGKLSPQASPGFVSHPTQAQTAAKIFLVSHGLWSESYDNGKVQIALFKVWGGNLLPAASLGETTYILVDFFRADLRPIEKVYPILPPNPKEGLIRVGIAKLAGANSLTFPFLKYSYQEFNREEYSEYPLEPIAKAWERLKKGEAAVAHSGAAAGEIAVNKIYLGFFDSSQPQKFLQPIYVFEGADFAAYVPAVDFSYQE